MAILRKKKKANYTIIDNGVFKDTKLSLKAKGLLCQMLSLPDGWSFSIEGLTRFASDGRDSVAKALNELKEAGYFYREQRRNDGKFQGIEYIVSETPFTEKPITEKPITEKPMTENPTLLNTNRLNTNKSNTKDIYKGLPENLVTALKDFEEMRKKLKAPMTDKAKELLLSKLTKLAGDNDDLKVRILEQSVEHSWKGVYELKDGNDFGSSDRKRNGLSGANGIRTGDDEVVEAGFIPRA